jgi:hypothetical protein
LVGAVRLDWDPWESITDERCIKGFFISTGHRNAFRGVFRARKFNPPTWNHGWTVEIAIHPTKSFQMVSLGPGFRQINTTALTAIPLAMTVFAAPVRVIRALVPVRATELEVPVLDFFWEVTVVFAPTQADMLPVFIVAQKNTDSLLIKLLAEFIACFVVTANEFAVVGAEGVVSVDIAFFAVIEITIATLVGGARILTATILLATIAIDVVAIVAFFTVFFDPIAAKWFGRNGGGGFDVAASIASVTIG